MAEEISRISSAAYTAGIFTFLAISLVAAGIRTVSRILILRSISLDDAFLIFAVVCLSVSAGIFHHILPLAFEQNAVSVGALIPGPDFPSQMLLAKKLETAGSWICWMAIYSVKLSYMFFFRSLVSRVRKIQIWWWVVLAVLVVLEIVTLMLDFLICPIFTLGFLAQCPVEEIVAREGVWLEITTVFDIFSDILVISIPVCIIWSVRLPLKSKIGLSTALCLSIFMVIIAIIRVVLADVAPGVTDTVWIYFWLFIEASTAVLMVSATAFRSIFGQMSRDTKATRQGNNYLKMGGTSTSGERTAAGERSVAGTGHHNTQVSRSGSKKEMDTEFQQLRGEVVLVEHDESDEVEMRAIRGV